MDQPVLEELEQCLVHQLGLLLRLLVEAFGELLDPGDEVLMLAQMMLDMPIEVPTAWLEAGGALAEAA